MLWLTWLDEIFSRITIDWVGSMICFSIIGLHSRIVEVAIDKCYHLCEIQRLCIEISQNIDVVFFMIVVWPLVQINVLVLVNLGQLKYDYVAFRLLLSMEC